MIPAFKEAFNDCGGSSSIKVLKLGSFKKSDLDYSVIFRQGFSRFKMLSLGTITVHTDLKDQEMSLTTILQENRSLYVVNHFTPQVPEDNQSACLTFFSESMLLLKSEFEELQDCYEVDIKKSESKYELKLIPHLSYLWPGFIRKPSEDLGLIRETKEKLLVRYILALINLKYQGIVQLELIYLSLKYLMEMNIHGYFQDGFSMIHKIILSRNNTLLEECFKIGLSLSTDTCDTNSSMPVLTSLQLILLSGNTPLLMRMLTYKPHVDNRDQFGNTLLHYACLYGDAEVTKRLIELNCEANAENLQGMQSLHTAVIGDSIECFLLVLNHLGKKTMLDNFVISQIPSTKQNCLHLAVLFNSKSVFNYCLDVLENLDLQDSKGKTAMMYAVEKANIEFVRRLLESSANPRLYDASGNNLLFYMLNIWGNLKRQQGEDLDDTDISSLFKVAHL
jgi:ankyrin repeat protein